MSMFILSFIHLIFLFNVADESRASLSQPEIITVRERIVNISSQAVLSDSEESSSGSAAGKLSHVGTQQYTFPRAKVSLQRQPHVIFFKL